MPDLLDGYSLSHILAHGNWDEDDALPNDRLSRRVCRIILGTTSVLLWLAVVAAAQFGRHLFGL